MENPPPVTVIIPMYNAVPLVAEAVASIHAQTCPVTRIIAVDDGSSDGSADFAGQLPRVEVLRKEHSGVAKTVNLGLDHVETEFVALLDHDDRWLPQKLEWQFAAFREDPGLDMVFGQAERFISNAHGEMKLDVLPGVAKSGGLFRTSVFQRVGRFSGDGHDFLGWFSRAQDAKLRHRVLEQIIYERRIHANSTGVLRKGAQRQNYFIALKTMLDRRRAAANPGDDAQA